MLFWLIVAFLAGYGVGRLPSRREMLILQRYMEQLERIQSEEL